MTEADRPGFAELLHAVYGFYRQGCSDTVLDIWWAAMRSFDLVAIRDALGRHAMNPDSGMFLPKPADVVRMLGGSTLDSAMMALAKLEAAMGHVGAYHTVVFDDSVIHRVVEEMGGWIGLCQTKSRDWEFRRTEFLNRYRGYRARGEEPPHQARLLGIFDAENSAAGFSVEDDNVRLVGDQAGARITIATGVGSSSVQVRRLKDVLRLPVEKEMRNHKT